MREDDNYNYYLDRSKMTCALAEKIIDRELVTPWRVPLADLLEIYNYMRENTITGVTCNVYLCSSDFESGVFITKIPYVAELHDFFSKCEKK